jgi:hypothetical protein
MPLYVKARNTHLKSTSRPSAQTLAVLQPGAQVTFLGREPGTPWCRVELAAAGKKAAKKGVIFQSNLASSPPAAELSSKQPGAPMDPQAFASSGAAVKALGPGVIDYGQQSTDLKPHVEGLKALEDLAATVDEAAIAKAAKAKKLHPVVGAPVAGGAR